MSNLKPCPFCGTEPNHITSELGDNPCFYYECENPKCGAAEKGWHDTEQEAINAWNTRPIEDALRKEIAQLQADNRSLVEQMNAMALKPNQEVIDWHSYIEKKPEKTGYYIIYYTILNRVAFDFWHNDKQEWDKYGEYILAWAYLPKGVKHE
jgi:Lar family restriction alleviation protein